MNTFSKFILATVTALTLVTSAAQADDRQAPLGVVVSEQNVLDASLAHAAQGR